jgi:hypothetical protein
VRRNRWQRLLRRRTSRRRSRLLTTLEPLPTMPAIGPRRLRLLQANKKSWGIGDDAVNLSPGSRMTGSPRAKENALQANQKNWGIGGDAPAVALSSKKEEKKEKVPEPKAAAAAPAAEGEVRMVWRQGYYNDKNVWQRGSYEVCVCVSLSLSLLPEGLHAGQAPENPRR